MSHEHSTAPPLPARLGLGDTISIIVGIIVGVGIFSAPGKVFRSVDGPWEAVGAWTLGGILSLIGALCFAELASAYPRSGGEYIYLSRAYGSGLGFLFAWAQLAVIRTGGGIAAVAYVFGDNAALLWGGGPGAATGFAALAIAALTLINILGANPGKHTQNLLTIAKVLGIGIVVLAGFSMPAAPVAAVPLVREGSASFALAMIFVLYTYDGWNEATYVCNEVQDWRRNMPRALVLGTAIVMVIYLLYNAACLVGLGFQAARDSTALHAELAARFLGPFAAQAVLVLVMVSALGGVNGTIFTAGRLYAALGTDHRLFAPLGRWNNRLGTPVCSLLVQALTSIGMVIAVGAYGEGQNGFETMVDCTAPVFWLFFLLTGASLLVLRRIDPAIERPFRVPGYPVLPLIFCGWCGYMLYGSIRYAEGEALIGIGVLAAGLPLYVLSRCLDRPAPEKKLDEPLPVSAGEGR